MLRVVFLDLGLTLVDPQQRPFPHAAEAVRTIQGFTGPGGERLAVTLVSDFDMVPPPLTPAKIRPVVNRYLAILDGTGLRPLFEPVNRRVTLSTHAGLFKPDGQVFTTALSRLRSDAHLSDCLLITENPAHVKAARAVLGMRALQFRSDDAAGFDFDDWRQAPSMVAVMIDGGIGPNVEAAVRRFLDVGHAFDADTITPGQEASGVTSLGLSGTLWKPIDAMDLADPLLVPVPARGEAIVGFDGRIQRVSLEGTVEGDAEQATSFARSLARHGQVEGSPGPLRNQETHAIAVDDQGRKKLVRKRFRAF
jgi:hypothetical protein